MTEEFLTTLAYEPGPDGRWSGPFYVDANGLMTHNAADGVAQTDKECPKGFVWCFTTEQWVDPLRQHGSGFEYEIQYVDGVETKRNYTPDTPEHGVLLEQYAVHRSGDGYISVISNKSGKLTAYIPDDGSNRRAAMTEFGVPQRNWGSVFAISIHADGSQSIKLYDQSVGLYAIPMLPEGAVIGGSENGQSIHGVACTWSNGVESPEHEVYFSAPRDAVDTWAMSLGLDLPDNQAIDYWGIVFDYSGDILHLKALKWIAKETGEVERCWVEGENIRSGYCGCDQSQEILQRVPQSYLAGHIMNVGANEYDLGGYGTREIISTYFKGSISQYHRDLFGVPEHVIPAPWYGFKYCPHYECEWLKLADMDYSRYTLPDIPDGAHRAFGVATTYAKSADQPPVHNGEGNLRDCSFITRDHGAVRGWCQSLGIADPAPHLPDTLILLGVYSITHDADTGAIQRVKFYCYHTAQRFEMELYLSAMLAGRDAGRSFDEPLYTEGVIRDARDRVAAFNDAVAA